MNDKWDPYDLYPDLSKVSNYLYKRAIPPFKGMREKPDIQEKIPSFYPKEPKKYTQDWKVYYLTCRNQKQLFFQILMDAVDYLDMNQEYGGSGRPPAIFSDMIKSLVIKSNFNLTSWGIESELKSAKEIGIIDRIYKKTSITKYLNSRTTTEYLTKLYKTIALPMIPLETEGQYATDATGMSHLFNNKKWVNVRLDKQQHRTFSKLHVIIGTVTNVVVAANVTAGTKHESPLFPDLLNQAAEIADMKEVTADAGYLSHVNCEAINDIGATPYIMPRKNVKGRSMGFGGSWGDMIRLWRNHERLFRIHYHRRSLVESHFAALKRKYLDYCRCKLPIAQQNEILSKIVCYNIWVLSQALLSDDVQPVFMTD